MSENSRKSDFTPHIDVENKSAPWVTLDYENIKAAQYRARDLAEKATQESSSYALGFLEACEVTGILHMDECNELSNKIKSRL